MEIIHKLEEIAGSRASNSPSELYCYSFDASQVKGRPDAVVRPRSAEEVSKILEFAHERGVPVTPRGAGTGLAGGAVPVNGGIVLDMSGMDRIIEIDIDNLQVSVDPGVVPEDLNRALSPYGFFFPPNPGSSAMCTIGGMIANNASGMRCVKYGTTRNYVLDLEVVTADGGIIHTGGRVLKSSAGLDLTRLFVGSEGCLGVITRARLRVTPLPETRRLIVASFEDSERAGRAVASVFSHGVTPSACEILDRTTLAVLRRCDPDIPLPSDCDVILFEVDGSRKAVEEAAGRVEAICSGAGTTRVISDAGEMDEVWKARSLAGAAVPRLDPRKSRVYMGEDVGVPLRQIPEMLRIIEEISKESGLPAMKYGHVGDGNIHVALFIDVADEEEWEKLRRAADEIHRAALSLEGTVSSEHGIGLARARYMREQWGPALDIMRSIKRAVDPSGILNPGKMDL